MHMSKKRRRDRLRNFFLDRTWRSQPLAAQPGPTQSGLRLKSTTACAKSPRRPLHCKTHMISLRNISRSSLLPRFHDLKKKDAQVGIQTSQSFKKDHCLQFYNAHQFDSISRRPPSCTPFGPESSAQGFKPRMHCTSNHACTAHKTSEGQVYQNPVKWNKSIQIYTNGIKMYQMVDKHTHQTALNHPKVKDKPYQAIKRSVPSRLNSAQ